MSQPAKFRCFLMQDENTYFYRDSSGAIATIASPVDYGSYAVTFPRNWDDIELAWGRNLTYWGIFRGFSSSAQFVGDAASICRYVYYTKGYEGRVYLKIEIRDDITWQYGLLYYGRLDLVSSTDDQLTNFSSEIDEAGVFELLKANENTPYLVEIDPSDSVKLALDGILLRSGYRYAPFSDHYLGVTPSASQGIPLIAVSTEGTYTLGEQKNQEMTEMGVVADSGFSPTYSVGSREHVNYLYEVDEHFWQPVTVYLKARHEVKVTNTGTTDHLVETRALVCPSATGVVYQNVQVFQDPLGILTSGASRNVVVDGETVGITMNPGDRLYYVIDAAIPTNTGATDVNEFLFFGPGGGNDYRIDVYIDFRLPPSADEGYRYIDAFKKLTAKMTDDTYEADSAFLSDPSATLVDSKPYYAVLTCGDAIRNLRQTSSGTYANPTLKLTMRQLFSDAFGNWLLGLGINTAGKLIMEPLSHFFDDTNLIADLGEVADFSYSTAKDMIFSEFKVGFPDETFDDVNGRDAYLLGATYKMPVTFPSKAQDFTSPFKADPYVIEALRANVSQKETTDTENDNAICVLDIDSTQTTLSSPDGDVTGYPLRRANDGSNTSGVISPETKFNISLSPGRKLRRMSPLVHSILYQLDDRTITFQASDKNSSLQSNIGSGTITEGQDVAVSSLSPILFKPGIISFTANPPKDLPALMAAAPYGYFKGTYRSKAFRVFAMDIKMRPAKSTDLQWSTIPTPTCDLTQFYLP